MGGQLKTKQNKKIFSEFNFDNLQETKKFTIFCPLFYVKLNNVFESN